MIYSIYIFNKEGLCLYYEEWNKKNPSQNQAEDQKLLFGMIYSLKSFLTKSSPKPLDPKTGFHCLKTSAYKLHFYETLSCLKFIILTDPNTPDLREDLKRIYSNIYVEYVIKNPLYQPNTVIKCEMFISQLNQLIRGLIHFSS
eukprot:gene1340-1692_t